MIIFPFAKSISTVYCVQHVPLTLSALDCGAIISQGGKTLWDRVWRAGEIQPRVRLHVWKLIHGVLLLGQILHSRIYKGDSACATCGEEYENLCHLLFRCAFARACWLTGPLPFQSD